MICANCGEQFICPSRVKTHFCCAECREEFFSVVDNVGVLNEAT